MSDIIHERCTSPCNSCWGQRIASMWRDELGNWLIVITCVKCDAPSDDTPFENPGLPMAE